MKERIITAEYNLGNGVWSSEQVQLEMPLQTGLSEARYKRLLESISSYVYTVQVDENQPISTTHGPGCLAVTGYTPQEYAENIYLWHKMIHEADRDEVIEQANLLIAGKSVAPLEHRIIHKDGTVRWVQNTTVVYKDTVGQVIGYDGVIIDITERKQAEEAYRKLVEYSFQGLIILQDEQIIFTNEALANITGYSFNRLQHMSADYFWQLVYPDDRDLVQERLLVRSEGRYIPHGFNFRFVRRDDTICWVEAFASPIEYRGRFALQISFLDITSRKEVEQEKDKLLEAVSRQQRQLRALSARLADTQEIERKNLSRELHDQIGQKLTALGFNLNLIQNLVNTHCPMVETLHNRLVDSLYLLEETTDGIYDVMSDLRPPVMDDYGLVPALNWYGRQWAQRTGVTVSVEGEGLSPRLPAFVEEKLFRITQEALSNVTRHAAASHVSIIVEDGTITRLTIADNGVGFDLVELSLHTERQHWGLITMREQAESIGGQFEIESEPERGTRVIVQLKRAEIKS